MVLQLLALRCGFYVVSLLEWYLYIFEWYVAKLAVQKAKKAKSYEETMDDFDALWGCALGRQNLLHFCSNFKIA